MKLADFGMPEMMGIEAASIRFDGYVSAPIDHLSCGTHLPETFASICAHASTFGHLAACFLSVLQHPLLWHLFLQLAAAIIV